MASSRVANRPSFLELKKICKSTVQPMENQVLTSFFFFFGGHHVHEQYFSMLASKKKKKRSTPGFPWVGLYFCKSFPISNPKRLLTLQVTGSSPYDCSYEPVFSTLFGMQTDFQNIQRSMAHPIYMLWPTG